jgi:hypothetical protein
VTYLEMVEFLVKEIEVKLEMDHLFSMLEFFMTWQEHLNKSITQVSPIFK